uniref:Uncharacterized protein n=1 Tax=Mus spicilegus TaxID=10103 RepID=A0A8C6MTV6_MUSSI
MNNSRRIHCSRSEGIFVFNVVGSLRKTRKHLWADRNVSLPLVASPLLPIYFCFYFHGIFQS